MLQKIRTVYEITHLAAEDLLAAGAVLDAAFRRTGMTANLLHAHALQPEHWFCVRSADRIVAMVGAIDYGRFATIGMMAVHPDVQHQGLGLRLMTHLVDHLDEHGCPALLLDASKAGQPLYPRLGFAAEGRTIRMARRSREDGHRRPDAAGTYLVGELTDARLPELMVFDTPLFGADRSAVIRSLLERYPGRSFIAASASGRVAGYLVAGTATIGPWCADSREAAEALLATALALPFADGPRLTFPDANRAGRDLLARYGFEETEALLHMRRGGSADPRQPGLVYGQASLTLG